MNKDVKKNPLDKHAFYTPCKKLIVEKLGIVKGCDIWAKAGDELANLLERYPGIEDKVGCEVIPAVAIYKVLEEAGYDESPAYMLYPSCRYRALLFHIPVSLPFCDTGKKGYPHRTFPVAR